MINLANTLSRFMTVPLPAESEVVLKTQESIKGKSKMHISSVDMRYKKIYKGKEFDVAVKLRDYD